MDNLSILLVALHDAFITALLIGIAVTSVLLGLRVAKWIVRNL